MRIENEVLGVELDAATGGFRSIYDKRTQREYVAAPDRALLWRAMTPEGDRHYEHVDGAAPSITLGDAKATLKYLQEGIEAEATLALGESGLLATLRITNAGTRNVEEVMFPWIRGLGPIADAAITWPWFWKRTIADPFGQGFGGDHHTWNELGQKLVARYPAQLATAWCDYGGPGGGLALEGRHTDFSIMDFFLHKVVEKDRDPVRSTLDMVTVCPRRIRPGESWESPPVRILTHPGDWHVVADQHREWLDTWIAKPDRPRKFAEAIGWHFFFMKHQDGLVVNSYDDMPRMAEAALAAGCPYLLVFGWQTGGHDNNYMYRYVPNEAWGGAEALREALRKVREMGVEVMPFFNGTLANVEMPEHQQFGRGWEAKTRAGHAYYAGDWARHNFDAPTRNRAMLHVEIAPCAEHRAYFLETVKRIVQDYGFGNTQLDQIAEKMFPDYAEGHIETTPDRVYVDGMAALLPKVRALVRAVNPDGVMLSEAINEFTGQWCDSSWDWTVLIPNPEPILYSLPWLFASHEVDALECGETNKAFAYKMHLDMKIDGGDAPITKYPAFARHVRSLAALRRRVAPYYVYGDFRDKEGITVHGPNHVLATVFHNRKDAKAGIVFAETEGKDAEVALDVAWRTSCPIQVDSNTIERTELRRLDQTPFRLNPYEVRVLCLDLE